VEGNGDWEVSLPNARVGGRPRRGRGVELGLKELRCHVRGSHCAGLGTCSRARADGLMCDCAGPVLPCSGCAVVILGEGGGSATRGDRDRHHRSATPTTGESAYAMMRLKARPGEGS